MRKSIQGKVYLVTQKSTGKQYIGLTTRPVKRRWIGHVSAAQRGKGSSKSLQEAIRSGGSDDFIIQEIARASSIEELIQAEIQYIKHYETLAPNGFNLNSGGAIGSGGDIYLVEGEEYFGLASLADAYGIVEVTMQKRMQSGRWTIEQACGLEPPPEYTKSGISINIDGRDFGSISEACNFYSVDPRVVDMRLKRLGWSIEEALDPKKRERAEFLVGDFVFNSLNEACRHFGLNYKKIESRIRNGWTINEAFDLEERPAPKRKKRAQRTERRRLVLEGEEYSSLAEVAKAYNLITSTLSYRLLNEWSLEQAVGLEPPPNKNPFSISIEFNGITFQSRAEICKHYGINESTFRFRLNSGWTIAQAVDLEPPPSQAKTSYRITSPLGEVFIVNDFVKFANEQGFPDDGRKLRRVSTTEKLHSWHGWKCEKL